MLKRGDAPYVSGRTETWLKLKCQARQELVICGFTDRANAHGEVGSLLLGYHEGGELKYAGNVGTGWNAKTGRDLHARLVKLEVAEPLFDAEAIRPVAGRGAPRAASAGSSRRSSPMVAFAEWTPDQHVRQAVFQGLRLDTPASSVRREQARDVAAAAPVRPAAAACAGAPPSPSPRASSSIKVTNPERVIDPSTGLTKLALVRYYESVAERILPHLVDRPVSLVRAPEGITGELFFQKHPETRVPGLRVLDKALWPGTRRCSRSTRPTRSSPRRR
jgi:bifunctional non-homologous end joining protein LigD